MYFSLSSELIGIVYFEKHVHAIWYGDKILILQKNESFILCFLLYKYTRKKHSICVCILEFFKNIMNITFNLLIIKKVNISIKGGV
ncbi:hypothetical protein A6A24_01105 [Bacillus subtilis]|nr:hypothetical protein A6A24_01105 [Bacillus subtilis]